MTPTQALFQAVSTKGTLASDIRSLIRQGANVNGRTQEGLTPLVGAALFLNRECVQILIDAGAVVDVRPNGDYLDGKTALLAAVSNTINDSGVIQVLIDAGADVNAADTFGRTALMYAAATSNLNLVETLVREGANINQRDKYGWSALGLAKQNNAKPSIIRFLADMGAKLSEKGR